MKRKKLLVNKKIPKSWFAPKKPEEKPVSIIQSINNRSAATEHPKGKGGPQIELFPTNGYVFSSKDMVDLLNVWNGTMVLPKIVSTRGREDKIREAMHDEFFRNNWREGIKKVAASRFCRGHNRRGAGQRPWIATVDWFLQPHVLPRVLEGQYDDKAPSITEEDKKFLTEEW